MWTRPAERAPSYGPCGEGLDKCAALAHPFPTLGALAPTSSPLAATTMHDKGDGTGSDRFPDCFVIPGNSSAELTNQFPQGSRGEMRETTARRYRNAESRSQKRILTPASSASDADVERVPPISTSRAPV